MTSKWPREVKEKLKRHFWRQKWISDVWKLWKRHPWCVFSNDLWFNLQMTSEWPPSDLERSKKAENIFLMPKMNFPGQKWNPCARKGRHLHQGWYFLMTSDLWFDLQMTFKKPTRVKEKAQKMFWHHEWIYSAQKVESDTYIDLFSSWPLTSFFDLQMTSMWPPEVKVVLRKHFWCHKLISWA